MTNVVSELLDRVMSLGDEQRYELICELMDRLVDDASLLTPEQKAELDRRAAFMDERPEALIPMHEAHRQIKSALGLPE